jgi:branched-chain amino acid transport system permease protein
VKNRDYIILAVGSIVFIVFPWVFTLPFPQHLMIMVFLYGTMGLAWNLLGGYAGQISLGHAVFFGVGAYTSTILFMHWGVSPWIGMAAGGLLAVILSLIIGIPCFRLAGHYFAIATIAIGEIAQQLMLNWEWAGGAVGLALPIAEESFGNFEFHTSKLPYYYIALGIFIGTILVTHVVHTSKLGYYFKAIKADQEAARSLGVRVVRFKSYAMGLSAFLTALCGSFYAQYVLFIDPDSVFPLMLSIILCLVATLGGVETVWGPVIGAFILIPISEGTRVYMGGQGSGIDLMLYGFLIMVICIYQPFGVIGVIKDFVKKGLGDGHPGSQRPLKTVRRSGSQ